MARSREPHCKLTYAPQSPTEGSGEKTDTDQKSRQCAFPLGIYNYSKSSRILKFTNNSFLDVIPFYLSGRTKVVRFGTLQERCSACDNHIAC